MTIDLFAASFICRDAEMDAIFDAVVVRAAHVSMLGRAWAVTRALLAGMTRRRSLA